jgi:hypothetical protein
MADYLASASFVSNQVVKIEELSESQCAAFLQASRVGRIAVSVRALPVIFPVGYVALDGAIWVGASRTSPVFRSSVGSVVAFEADGYDEPGSYGWSVLVRGVAEAVSDERKIEEVNSRLITAWPAIGVVDQCLAIPVTMLTGQRYRQDQ